MQAMLQHIHAQRAWTGERQSARRKYARREMCSDVHRHRVQKRSRHAGLQGCRINTFQVCVQRAGEGQWAQRRGGGSTRHPERALAQPWRSLRRL